MWVVLDLNGDPIATFPGDNHGWWLAVRYMTRNGGEFELALLTHFTPKEYEPNAA